MSGRSARFLVLLGLFACDAFGIVWTGSLVSGWRFEEASGTSAADFCGSLNGTLSNSPSWVTGKIGRGIQFNGTNSAVSLGAGTSLDLKPITVAFWAKVNVNSVDQWRRIVSAPNSFTNKYAIAYPGDVSSSVNTRSIVVNWNGSAYQTPTNSFLPSVWNHVAMTHDGSSLKIYINGVSQALTTPGYDLGIFAGDWLLGNRPALDRGTDGVVDELRIYRKALSASEVRSLMLGYEPKEF